MNTPRRITLELSEEAFALLQAEHESMKRWHAENGPEYGLSGIYGGNLADTAYAVLIIELRRLARERGTLPQLAEVA